MPDPSPLARPPQEVPADLRTHPDRVATTLADRARLLATGAGSEAAEPERTPAWPARTDCRVDLALAAWRARAVLAARGTDAARARLAGLDSPQLLARTVQDGTARGLAVAYEEAVSLCAPEEGGSEITDQGGGAGGGGAGVPRGLRARSTKELRRLRDVAVPSGGARIRWTRREGLLLVDRDDGLHAPSFVWFEDRRDAGDLDAFVPVEGDRPRMFRPQSLTAESLLEGPDHVELRLVGRLGRGPRGFDCRLMLIGRADRERVELRVSVRDTLDAHRLRIRFDGLPDPACVAHEGTPGFVQTVHGGRVAHAATLVRACARLRVGEPARDVAVPAAAPRGWLHHAFHIGGARRAVHGAAEPARL